MQPLRPPAQESDPIHIIGQGLAGSILALLLIDRGYKVHVFDNNYRTSSSTVAAGMWNPLSFKTMKGSWFAHRLIPELEVTYPRLESMLGVSFFHPKRLLRIFPDAGAANLWDEKCGHPDADSFIEHLNISDSEQHYWQPHGHGVVRGAGWLDVPVFLSAARAFLQKRNSYTETEIDMTQLAGWLQNGHWVFQCTGWKPLPGLVWEGLRIQTNKGQVLTLRMDGLSEEYMTNFGKFAIPIGDGVFRVGSTYEHGALDTLPSEAADEIKRQVERCVRHPYTILDHKAGFRPTTPDRHPVLGAHNKHPRLCLFNGFGSRGVMLIPYFAKHLLDSLANGTSVMSEVDWRRFEQRKGKQ